MSHKLKKKMIRFSQEYAFWRKKIILGILKFLRIFWTDLFSVIGFFEAGDMDYLLILSRNDFKGSLNAKINFNFESITYEFQNLMGKIGAFLPWIFTIQKP